MRKVMAAVLVVALVPLVSGAIPAAGQQEAARAFVLVSLAGGAGGSGSGVFVSEAEVVALLDGADPRYARMPVRVTLTGAMRGDGISSSSSRIPEEYFVEGRIACWSMVARGQRPAAVVRVRLDAPPRVTVAAVPEGGVMTGVLRVLDYKGSVQYETQASGTVQVIDYGPLPLLSVTAAAGVGHDQVVVDYRGRFAGWTLPLTDGRVVLIPAPPTCGRVPDLEPPPESERPAPQLPRLALPSSFVVVPATRADGRAAGLVVDALRACLAAVGKDVPVVEKPGRGTLTLTVSVEVRRAPSGVDVRVTVSPEDARLARVTAARVIVGASEVPDDVLADLARRAAGMVLMMFGVECAP